MTHYQRHTTRMRQRPRRIHPQHGVGQAGRTILRGDDTPAKYSRYQSLCQISLRAATSQLMYEWRNK